MFAVRNRFENPQIKTMSCYLRTDLRKWPALFFMEQGAVGWIIFVVSNSC